MTSLSPERVEVSSPEVLSFVVVADIGAPMHSLQTPLDGRCRSLQIAAWPNGQSTSIDHHRHSRLPCPLAPAATLPCLPPPPHTHAHNFPNRKQLKNLES
jgi:hypothetical protein